MSDHLCARDWWLPGASSKRFEYNDPTTAVYIGVESVWASVPPPTCQSILELYIKPSVVDFIYVHKHTGLQVGTMPVMPMHHSHGAVDVNDRLNRVWNF